MGVTGDVRRFRDQLIHVHERWRIPDTQVDAVEAIYGNRIVKSAKTRVRCSRNELKDRFDRLRGTGQDNIDESYEGLKPGVERYGDGVRPTGGITGERGRHFVHEVRRGFTVATQRDDSKGANQGIRAAALVRLLRNRKFARDCHDLVD